MTKPLHPIQKMCYALEKVYCDTQHFKTVAQHVKPLLDALAETHELEGRALYPLEAESGCPYDPCWVCNLLAAWRAKL